MLGYNKPDLSVHKYQAAQASHRYFSWYFCLGQAVLEK